MDSRDQAPEIQNLNPTNSLNTPLISKRQMPRDSTLRKTLSWAASKLSIRQNFERFVTVVYIKSGYFFIDRVPFSTSTTMDNIKEVIAPEMGLSSTESLIVFILPYGCDWHDERLINLRRFDCKDSERLIMNIPPKFTIRGKSLSGYPRAVCMFGSSISLEDLLHPWNPAHVQFFMGVENTTSTAAIPDDTLNQMYMYRQLQTLFSASIIRRQGSDRDSERQTAFRAARIACYALEYHDNIRV